MKQWRHTNDTCIIAALQYHTHFLCCRENDVNTLVSDKFQVCLVTIIMHQWNSLTIVIQNVQKCWISTANHINATVCTRPFLSPHTNSASPPPQIGVCCALQRISRVHHQHTLSQNYVHTLTHRYTTPHFQDISVFRGPSKVISFYHLKPRLSTRPVGYSSDACSQSAACTSLCQASVTCTLSTCRSELQLQTSSDQLPQLSSASLASRRSSVETGSSADL